MSILVTGGAGYIGSHVVYALSDRGEKVVVLDNLSTGIRAQISEKAIFVEGNAADAALVRETIRAHDIKSVIHFAGSIVVPESVAEPLRYYFNNTSTSRDLIETCVNAGVEHFIFSSTATVYSETAGQPLAEESAKAPISPYARSKLMTEWMLEDASRAFPQFRHMVLRYFNVAGADPKGRTGQSSPLATHLIKRACQVALGRIPHLDIFGTDFPTADGTGVRDYIHVTDLADAHLLALDSLRAGSVSTSYNCGYGRGLSVKQVIAGVESITGKKLPAKLAPRRPGDPPVLIADSSRLKANLHWQPRHDDLTEIISSALRWESRFNS